MNRIKVTSIEQIKEFLANNSEFFNDKEVRLKRLNLLFEELQTYRRNIDEPFRKKEEHSIEYLFSHPNECQSIVRTIRQKTQSLYNRTTESISNLEFIFQEQEPDIIPKYNTDEVIADIDAISQKYEVYFGRYIDSPTIEIVIPEVILSNPENRRPITLSFGQFKIIFILRLEQRISGSVALLVQPLDPDNARRSMSSESITHPNISDDRLCLGDSSATVRTLLKNFHFLDAFDVINSIVNTYGYISPYAKLETFLEDYKACVECQREILSEDDGGEFCCAVCGEENTFCNSCVSECSFCNDLLCPNCTYYCNGCGKHICIDCGMSCEHCGERYCKDCLVVCESCSEMFYREHLSTCREHGRKYHACKNLDKCPNCGTRCADCVKIENDIVVGCLNCGYTSQTIEENEDNEEEKEEETSSGCDCVDCRIARDRRIRDDRSPF